MSLNGMEIHGQIVRQRREQQTSRIPVMVDSTLEILIMMETLMWVWAAMVQTGWMPISEGRETVGFALLWVFRIQRMPGQWIPGISTTMETLTCLWEASGEWTCMPMPATAMGGGRTVLMALREGCSVV